jgi:D-glycero-D-manno-heptose 1,7-bisphosphate phosphatase
MAAIEETKRQCEDLFDMVSHCPHHPDAKTLQDARCWCRKPLTGLPIAGIYALQLRHPWEYYPPHLALVVGDRPEDQEMARLLNVDFRWADEWRSGV